MHGLGHLKDTEYVIGSLKMLSADYSLLFIYHYKLLHPYRSGRNEVYSLFVDPFREFSFICIVDEGLTI